MTSKCNLIVDSCCDLPFDIINVPGVSLVQFPFFLDGVECEDDMYRTLTPKKFYDAMRDKKRDYPTTAQVPASVLTQAFTAAAESGVPTVYLCFASALSGTYDIAQLVRDDVVAQYPDAELYVVDTKLASVAEGLLVLGALEQREKGLTALEMVEWVKEARYFVGAEFMVDDLDALRRGGRIPAGVAFAGAKLDVKPILSFDLDGNLTLVGMSRGRKKGIRALVDYYTKHVEEEQPAKRVIIANADCPKDQSRLRSELEKLDSEIFFVESNIGPVIGSHVGPGMIAVVCWTDDRRKDNLSVADRIARRVREKE